MECKRVTTFEELKEYMKIAKKGECIVFDEADVVFKSNAEKEKKQLNTVMQTLRAAQLRR